MRRLFTFIAAAALPLLATSFAFAAEGGIEGSKHDFSAATWSDQEICKPCHTPHNALDTNLTGRLWAHTLSTQTYVYHGGSTATDGSTRPEDSAGSAAQSDFDVASRLCLSCHDGTVALDSFMGKEGTSDGMGIGASPDHGSITANLGQGAVANDLSNDHPVGFKALYRENYQPSPGHYVYNPSSAVIAAGLRFATSPTPVPAGATDSTGTTLTGNYKSVSCVTCHDVHNGRGHKEGLLRMDNTGSAMCLACHNK